MTRRQVAQASEPASLVLITPNRRGGASLVKLLGVPGAFVVDAATAAVWDAPPAETVVLFERGRDVVRLRRRLRWLRGARRIVVVPAGRSDLVDAVRGEGTVLEWNGDMRRLAVDLRRRLMEAPETQLVSPGEQLRLARACRPDDPRLADATIVVPFAGTVTATKAPPPRPPHREAPPPDPRDDLQTAPWRAQRGDESELIELDVSDLVEEASEPEIVLDIEVEQDPEAVGEADFAPPPIEPRRRPRLWLPAMLVLLAGLGGVGLAWWYMPRPRPRPRPVLELGEPIVTPVRSADADGTGERAVP